MTLERTGVILNEREPHLRVHQLGPAELALFIQCAWRLGDGERVLASSANCDELEIRGYERLTRMVGSAVSRSKLLLPFFDLSITLDNGLQLDMFCDQSSGDDDANYTMETYQVACTVATSGRIFVTQKISNTQGIHVVTDV
jgi:hypothetical protein